MPRRNPSIPRALERLRQVTAPQELVCTTRQARAAGLSPDAIERLLASCQWIRLHRGVYRIVPGLVPLRARMWAAHLALGPDSVIGGPTAAHHWGLLDEVHSGPVTALVPESCTRVARGVRTVRIPSPGARAHPARTPPVVTVEHAVCDVVASSTTDAAAAEVILRACRMRLTSPDRILAAARSRPRLRRRHLLTNMCADVVQGVTSPLERAYRDRVERAHGLPSGRRQSPGLSSRARRTYRDVEYPDEAVVVELDGRLGHETESAIVRDQLRDNEAALSGRATLRFGWLGVIDQPCEAARQVGALLQQRGWRGRPRACGPSCPIGTVEGRPAA